MKLVALSDLIDKPIAGVRVDIRTRYDDGSLRYPEQQPQPIMVELKAVTIEQRGYCCGSMSKKPGEQGKFPWLMWRWSGYSCDYAGVRIDNGQMPEIYLAADLDEWITTCALCHKGLWLPDSYSPGDEAICAECDTEVTGRAHEPTLAVPTTKELQQHERISLTRV